MNTNQEGKKSLLKRFGKGLLKLVQILNQKRMLWGRKKVEISTTRRKIFWAAVFVIALAFVTGGYAAKELKIGHSVEIVVINDPNTPEIADLFIDQSDYRFDPKTSVLYIDMHNFSDFVAADFR